MTKNRFEYDWNRQTPAVRTWPKMTKTKVNLLNLTKNDWIWPKVKNIKNNTTTTKIDDWTWPNITRHVRHCGNFYFKFRSSSSREFLSLSVFSYVQLFRSHSFGHLESVMLTFLFNISMILNKCIIQWFSIDVTI